MRAHRDIKHPKRDIVLLEKQGRNWVILRGGGAGFYKLQEKRNNKSVAKMIVFLGVLKSLNVLVHSILAGQLVGPTITVQ